ncbi:hypothetical protein, partial [Geobacillus sp. Geo 8.1]
LLVPRHPPCALSSLTYCALGFFLCFIGYLVFKERSCCLESASLQLCAEESIFLEPAGRRRRKTLEGILIPSKLNETEARFALNND